ncbi:MAG: MopE-related protein [Sandaracinaceae bacterium]
MSPPISRGVRVLVTALAVALLHAWAASPAHAFEPFAFLVPCRATAVNSTGTERPCITCHNNPNGGAGCMTPPCFNPFGMAFNANGRVWNATLAMMDSDGDGFTNGEELGDPLGTWNATMAFPMCTCPTRPGFDTFTPADTDADMDGYCCLGHDTDSSGDCHGAGELDGSLDCNDADATVHTGRAEVCTNAIDNDCDGDRTLFDSECAMVVDRDGDGYCPMGIDLNRDRDCTDAMENTSDVDCDDTEATRSPAAGENCVDSLDNDCDGDVDLADADCTSDVDADMDGFCPIGADTDMDGNCNGVGELTAGFDCNDSRADVNSAQMELCVDGVDNDCDGLADARDGVDCGALYDADGDGYCPVGQDVNRNGNCADPGEDALPSDCNDTVRSISPGAMELCLDTDTDEDCDGLVSLADPGCAGYIDADGDHFCFVGADLDRNGVCTGMGEQDGRGDCDETSVDVRPTTTELCTDGIDNNCDGSTDADQFFVCDDYRDRDRDHFCFVGADLNGDFDCADPGEQSGPTEWTAAMDPFSDPMIYPLGTEEWPTRYPGAPEHCLNGIDEDLDMLVDEAGYCRRDVDMDGDGHCPLGTDLNEDGDCEDAGENTATTDCNDSNATINAGQPERCLEPVDADCDGLVGTRDSDCFRYLDRDHDGVCGVGIDDNADGDCLDASEQRFGVDCDDRDPAVNSRVRETACADGIDNDCDGAIDYDDSQCLCASSTDCDDSDPCTSDTCNASGGCDHTPNPAACADAGMTMADAGPPTTRGGCDCRAASGTSRSPAGAGVLLLLAMAFIARRRARKGDRCR